MTKEKKKYPQFKIVEDTMQGFNVMKKTSWWRPWKYVRRKTKPFLVWRWDTRRGAQAFINLQGNGKSK